MKYRGPYTFILFLLAILQFCSSNLYSGPKLCLSKLEDHNPSNVTLVHEYALNDSSPEDDNISVYAGVSGNILHITSGDYGTKIEVRKWVGKGTTGGMYAEIPGETLCWQTWCPPVTSLGDFIGIPTIIAQPSKVGLMYTIFLVPMLEERVRDCVISNRVCLRSIESLWSKVIEDCCGAFFAVVVIAIVGIVVFMPRRAATLPPEHQEPAQGELQVLLGNVQLCERMVLPFIGRLKGWERLRLGAAQSTSVVPDIVTDYRSPHPLPHSSGTYKSRYSYYNLYSVSLC